MSEICHYCNKARKKAKKFKFPAGRVDSLLKQMRDRIIADTEVFDAVVQDILKNGFDKGKKKVFMGGLESIITLAIAHQRVIRRLKV